MSKDLINTEFDYKIGVGFSFSAISSYYDGNELVQTGYPKGRFITFDNNGEDSTFFVNGEAKIDYTEFKNNYFGEFKLSNDLIGRFGVNIAHFSADNSFTFNDTIRDENGNIKYDNFDNALFQRVNIDDFNGSLFRVMYLRPSVEYYLINDKENIFSVIAGIQIPLGFEERSIPNDSSFIGDGYLQFNGNVKYRAIYETIELELGGGYFKRTEIYNDLANINATVFFTKVENAYFYAKADYYSAMGVDESQELILTELPYSESFLNTQFGLNVFFDDFELQFDYTFVPFGKNYWVQNILNGSFHYYFK
ncbi:MAG: hypothetical protein ACE364_12335 [Chlorobiota bacterium]